MYGTYLTTNMSSSFVLNTVKEHVSCAIRMYPTAFYNKVTVIQLVFM